MSTVRVSNQFAKSIVSLIFPTVEGSLRLRSSGRFGGIGPNVSTGLLEVYTGGGWGTVCDDLFTQTSADLSCRQLGYFFANGFGDVDSP